MPEQTSSGASERHLATRWLGVGLASCLAVVTVALAVTGDLALYVNPDSAWFVVGMAVLLLAGAVASFALPLGAEADHGHAHAHVDAPGERPRPGRANGHAHADGAAVGTVATVTGGLLASGVVLTALVAPAASLSAELAMARDVGAPPMFAGADVLTLASSGDTSAFGIGDWASVFATATDPDTFDGDPITLTGFVTPGDGAGFSLTRLVITHCVIDAQPASLPVVSTTASPETGQWVQVTGTVRSSAGGALEIRADVVAPVDQPAEPYEY